MKTISAISMLLFSIVASAGEPPIVIRNAAVETLGKAGRIENAMLLIRDGKIAAVGKSVDVPADASVIDAAGGTVMPGIIDPYFEVTIAAATPDAAPRTFVGRGGGPRNFRGGFGRGSAGAFTRIADNFYPHDPGFKHLPRVGLTRINLVAGGAGQAAVVRGVPADPDHMLAVANGIAYAAVTNSSESLDQVRTRLQSASRAGRGTTAAGSELWKDVFDGKTPLLAHPNNAAAVLHLLKATEPFRNVKLALYLSGDAVAETLDELKARKVQVILRPALELLPNTRDRFNPARMLYEAGIDFAFSLTARQQAAPAAGRFAAQTTEAADSTGVQSIDADFPLFPVAMLVKTGLPRSAALEALARRPAILLGLEKTHGTIEPGKSADLLLFSGDPLDPAGQLKRTIVEGRITYAN